MPTAMETQIEQKKRLYQLMRIKTATPEDREAVIDELITATIAEMQQEDVAWVEKTLKPKA